MDILKNFSSNYGMQVRLHKIKYQIDVFIILCADKMLQTNDIRMSIELP